MTILFIFPLLFHSFRGIIIPQNKTSREPRVHHMWCGTSRTGRRNMAKILVTDDSLFLRVTLKTMLQEGGYEVCEAVNGLDMLKQYEIEKPDLVTLDITMPELDGRGALRELKARHPEAKVIMCSAMGQRNMVLEAIKEGAYDFIVKPFEKSKVLDSVRKVLAMQI